MTKDNSGPAFPACNEANNNFTMGMTLRDYFAGQALAGMCANCDRNGGNGWVGIDDMAAKKAYIFADAMLEARKQ